MGLASEVLALHHGIREAMIIENQTGEIHVADQAGRENPPFSQNGVSARENESTGLALADLDLVYPIFDAASQVGNVQKAGEFRLVGMLYEHEGVVCVPIDDDSYLMVTAAKESIPEVMKTIEHSLPNIALKRYSTSQPLTINSASDVDRAVRSFFANTRLSEPSSIHMQDAILNTTQHSWQVSGSYRPTHALRSKRYYIEVDATTGAVTKFQART